MTALCIQLALEASELPPCWPAPPPDVLLYFVGLHFLFTTYGYYTVNFTSLMMSFTTSDLSLTFTRPFHGHTITVLIWDKTGIQQSRKLVKCSWPSGQGFSLLFWGLERIQLDNVWINRRCLSWMVAYSNANLLSWVQFPGQMLESRFILYLIA